MLTLQQAREVYLGRQVQKEFPPIDSFPGGVFSGIVKKIDSGVPDRDGIKWDMLFSIQYEDGDKEHLTEEELQECLVDRAAVLRKRREVLAAAAAAAHAGENDENDEAVAAAAQHARQLMVGVLGDATERRRNAAGHERRSRREGKRRMDEEYQYEDPRGSKRPAAAGGNDAAIRSRFGIRQPTQAAATAAANQASESQDAVPLGEGGMRLTGLPGHLMKIEVVNFMCHENFSMDFGEHVTFVSGTNGSGKSAVLQALQCCLGVRAAHTGRARTFQKFIRTGADEAIIRVTVYNRPYKGHDAYRHALFGDTITVERRISRVGASSSYALKDSAGRVQGRKREDLDAMLSTLGLNAANPVCVMTQDTARNFLAGSSNKSDQEKYALYMEATSLEQISYNLEVSKAQVRQMDETVAQIREEYDAMVAHHGELQKSIKALEGIQGWRQEVEQLEQVLTWSVVDEQAEGAARVLAALEGMPAQLAELEAAVEELQREHAALKQATEDKSAFLTNYNNRATELAAEAEALKQQAKEAHRAARAAEAKIQRLREGLQEAQAHKETLETAVKEVQDDVVQATQAAVAQYQQQLGAAQAADDACREEVAGVDGEYQRLAAATKAAHERKEAVSSQCYAAASHVQALQQQVQQIREAGRSKAAAFGGRPAASLAAAIQRSKAQFSRLPIGPVGQYLSLEDPRWAMAVEAAISLQLNAFLVHTMADGRLLRQMIAQQFQGIGGIRPSVFVVNFDLPQHVIPPASQPPPAIPTIYRVLRCADRKVAAPILNNLVDQAHIEKLALGGSGEACKSAAWQAQNVSACYAPDGSKYYRRGSTNTSIPPPHWLRCARLGVSAAQQTSELEREVQRAQQELAQLELQFQQAQADVAAANAAEVEARRGVAAVKRKRWETQTVLTQLTQQPPPEVLAATQGGGDNDTHAEIWQAAQACIDLEQQLREKQGAAEEAGAAARQAVDALREKRDAMTRLNEENEAFVSSYHQEVEQLQAVAARLAEAREAGEAARARRAQLQQLAAQQAQELAQVEEGAAALCSREAADEARRAVEERLRGKRDMGEEEVASLLTPELLRKKVALLERKIAEHERAAGGSLAELQDAFAASSARMGRDGRRFREAISTYQVVDDALKLRTKKLSELDHRLEDLVNAKFRQYMWKKGHSGMIKLDRKAQSLQLKVQIGCKGSKEGGAVKDLKQLSGGERSYTTVAFTLALGGHTEMPFRAMDEFDVFMDAINRRVAMQNLFCFAKEYAELQFIFLTPQDISAVDDARQACQQQGHELPAGFVRVISMRPPRANATRVQ